MGKTSIEWTDASWNPVVGCTEVSPGCANCYAARLAATRLREVAVYRGLASGAIEKIPGANRSHRFQRGSIRWTGETRMLPDRLDEPRRWHKPLRIFVCDMGDLFHESVSHGFLLEVFQAMAAAPQHTYQILTKRPARMKDWLTNFALVDKFHPLRDDCRWPWPNVWCGVSVENQHFADERIPLLLETPAVVRWISAEPLLSEIHTGTWLSHCEGVDPYEWQNGQPVKWRAMRWKPGLDWVVCGGESGPNARPMHPDWAQSLRDQCQAAGVPFFFKQWGEWQPYDASPEMFQASHTHIWGTGVSDRTKLLSVRVGKKSAGRLLDGRTWDEFPK